MKVCLANDSFPPQIDGVANTTLNYAEIINKNHGAAIVATPSYKYNEDEKYPFPIVRYPSIPLGKTVGYNAGYPFERKSMKRVIEFKPDIIHSHCPMISQLFCRELRSLTKKPLVFTYHTKFDIDIKKCLKLKILQEALISIMVSNIEASDEVWVVSRGAGENLKSMGFKGDYVVMQNGVDIAKMPENPEIVKKLRTAYGLSDPNVPIFLSVGRMKWYKGHRLTIDALRMLKDKGFDFRMIFVGTGSDFDEIKRYAFQNGISEKCIFTGTVINREELRNHYFLADMFIFPSTYDTNGIVVREAAACNLGSVLIRGSCAAEDTENMQNSVWVDENAESLFTALLEICEHREKAREIGACAGRELYISWEDSIATAEKRYNEVIKRCSGQAYNKFRLDSKGIEFVSGTYRAIDHMKAFLSDSEEF